MKKILVLLLMLVSMNANAQWVQMGNGITGEAVILTATTSGNNIYIGTSNPSTITGGLFTSTNYGVNWTQIPFVNMPVTAIAASGNNIYAGASSNTDSGVYVSTNTGLTWTHSSLNNRSIASLSVYGSNVYAGSLNHGVYLSTNNGFNWNQIGLSTKDVHCVALNGSFLYAGVEGTGLYFSTDNGVNWTQTALNDKSVMSIAFSGNTIYAGTLHNGVYISTNNGISWTQSALNDKTVWSLLVNGSNIFAGINYNGTGGVYISTNNGTSWILKTQGLNPSTMGVTALVTLNNYIFAGTIYSIWRRGISEIIGIQNISTETPSKYSLGQNYPNPFNPMCNVQFSMYNAGNVRLVVYDVQGREVQTLVNEKLSAGTYEVKFDGSALNSGVYFYKLMTDGFTETKKMLMIK